MRHTPLQDKAFLLLKKYQANINPRDIIIDCKSKVLDLDKVHTVLSLQENAAIVLKMSPVELNYIGCSDLISDEKLLRHNLNICYSLSNGNCSKEDYILRCNENDRNLRLSLGIEPPPKEELHSHYQFMLSKTCTTPSDVENLKSFLKGESNVFIYNFKFQKEFGILSHKKSCFENTNKYV